MQKHLRSLAATILAVSLAAPLAAQEAAEITGDTVVATVGGVDITVGHMIAARATLDERYNDVPAQDLYNGILQQLIQQQALALRTDNLPRIVQLTLENEERSLKAAEELNSALKTAVSDEEVQAAYDAQYANVDPEEQYNASHILLETEEEAVAVKAELDAGADFAATAREKSTGPSGPNGGELGWFGTGMMVPAFEAATIALAVGEISDPTQTQFGWHVIRLNDTRRQEIPALEDVREELLDALRNEAARAIVEGAPDTTEVVIPEVNGLDPAILSQRELLEP